MFCWWSPLILFKVLFYYYADSKHFSAFLIKVDAYVLFWEEALNKLMGSGKFEVIQRWVEKFPCQVLWKVPPSLYKKNLRALGNLHAKLTKMPKLYKLTLCPHWSTRNYYNGWHKQSPPSLFSRAIMNSTSSKGSSAAILQLIPKKLSSPSWGWGCSCTLQAKPFVPRFPFHQQLKRIIGGPSKGKSRNFGAVWSWNTWGIPEKCM